MTFVSTTCSPKETISLTIMPDNLTDAIEAFERFLRGAGYVFDGSLTIVSNIEIKGVDDEHG
jgi:hypothetical protein